MRVIALIGKSEAAAFPRSRSSGDTVGSSTVCGEILITEIDIEKNHIFRRNWGLFRDRRIDLYKELLTLDGKN